VNDNHSFATDPCGRILVPAQAVAKNECGQLYCWRCRDPFVPIITKPWSRSPKVVALSCINCNEKIQVRRGFLVTRPPLPWRLGWHLSRILAGVAL
jgi:hypothetical protein